MPDDAGLSAYLLAHHRPAVTWRRVVINAREMTMPDKSKAQQRAMGAAAAGRSTLGIPAKVGKDFIAADKARGSVRLPERKRPAGRGK